MVTDQVRIDFNSNFVQIVNGKVAPTQLLRQTLNPSNEQALPPVPVATEQDVDDAVCAGKAAFHTWSRLSYLDRQKAVLAFAAAIKADSTELTQLLTREHGKTVSYTSLELYLHR